MSIRNLKSAFEQHSQTREDKTIYLSGNLGISLDGKKSVTVPGRDGYVFVRLLGNTSELIQAYSAEVALIYDLPVQVTRVGNKWVVTGRDIKRYGNWGTSAYLPPHGIQHTFDLNQYGGGDITWIRSEQFLPLDLFPSVSGTGLTLYPYTYLWEDTWKQAIATGTSDLTVHNPPSASGTSVMVLVYLDGDNGNPVLVPGTPFASSITGIVGLLPYIPTIGTDVGIPLYAVRLEHNTTFLDWTMMYDLRQFYMGGGATSTGTSGVSDHTLLTNLNSANYTHLTAVQATDLTDGGATALHSHAVPAHTQNANTIIIPNGVGSPTYDDVQDYLQMTRSAGRLTGGEVTAGATGTVGIAGMEGMIFTTDSLGGEYIYFNQASGSTSALTDNSVNWVYFDWNGGTPRYLTTIDRSTVHEYDQFAVARVWRSGNTVEVLKTGHNLYNKDRRSHNRLILKYGGMDRISGANITAHATPLRLSCDAGTWYVANTPYTTALADKFTVMYRTGGGAWTESAELTLFSEVFDGGTSKVYETYQNGTSLATLSGSKYGVYWVFINPLGKLIVVLGTADYANVGAAQAATVPASLPARCTNWSRLIGRVICQKTAAAFYSVESVWAQSFTLSAATDHASLANVTPMSATGHPAATAAVDGYATAVQITKLDGIAAGANAYVHPNHSGDVTSVADGAQTIGAKKVTVAMLADGTDGQLITWDAAGVAAVVPTGTATHVLTFNGAGAAPTFQAATGGATIPALPDGYVWNGQIVVTVASNNLTVAIKGLDGNDPSAGNPVKVRIGNTERTITAALSVTKNAGTNWFLSGSAELAAKEVDYFVYLGYNATDGVVVGISRLAHGRRYDDFSATAANDRYCAISTITNAAAADEYVCIGRIPAILAAGAGYTWTLPTLTNRNVINHPINETRWLDWKSTWATFSSLTTDITRYKLIGSVCYLQFRVVGSHTGVQSTLVGTLPISYGGTMAGVTTGAGLSVNPSAVEFIGIYVSSGGPTVINIMKYNGANFATNTIVVNGSIFYEL